MRGATIKLFPWNYTQHTQSFELCVCEHLCFALIYFVHSLARYVLR